MKTIVQIRISSLTLLDFYPQMSFRVPPIPSLYQLSLGSVFSQVDDIVSGNGPDEPEVVLEEFLQAIPSVTKNEIVAHLIKSYVDSSLLAVNSGAPRGNNEQQIEPGEPSFRQTSLALTCPGSMVKIISSMSRVTRFGN